MTNGEIQTIRNVLARLKAPNLGSHPGPFTEPIVAKANACGLEVVSRLYLDSWVVPALELLLPESRDVDLAVRVSK